MNKRQQRELENKIREAMEEPAELTEDEIADIRNRAYRAYQKKMDDRKQPSKSGIMKSGLLRRVVAVFAIAIGLIVMSVVYSVIAPVTSSSANSFVRRAAIWVNDQLHLGISFPVPEERSNVNSTDYESIVSLKEASEKLDMPIIYLSGRDDLLFRGIETVASMDDSTYLILHYDIGKNEIDISIEKLSDDEILSIDTVDANSFHSPIGEILLWETEGMSKAFTMIDGYLVEIYGQVSKELLISYCNFLVRIN